MGKGAKRLPAAFYEKLGPECQLRGRAGKSLARSWSWANGFRKTRQQGSCRAVLRGRTGPKEAERVWRAKRKEEVGARVVGY